MASIMRKEARVAAGLVVLGIAASAVVFALSERSREESMALPGGGANVVVEGDSITAGIGATRFDRSWTPMLLASYSAGEVAGLSNVATSGDDLPQMLAEAPLEVDPRFLKGRTNIAVLFGGTNDINNVVAPDPQAVFGNYKAWCDARRARGFKVVAVTILPRVMRANPNGEADRQAVNRLIRARWPAFADALVDIGSDPLMGQAGQYASAYYRDGVHPADSGHARIAAAMKPAVDSLR